MGILLSAMAAAGDAGVQSMNQNIEQMNRQDLESQRSELETNKAKLLADYNIQAKIAADDQVRNAKTDEVNTAAQQLAQGRANADLQSQADAAESAYRNAPDLSDEDRQAGIIASRRYVADNQSTAKASNRDMIQASVNSGYTDPTKLYEMDKQDAQAAVQGRLAALKEQREEDWKQIQLTKDETQNRRWDIESKRVDAMIAKISSGGGKDVPASIQTTEWLIKNKDDPVAMAAWEKQGTGKSKNIINLAADFLNHDVTGKMTVEKSYAMADSLISKAEERAGASPATTTPPPSQSSKLDSLFPTKK